MRSQRTSLSTILAMAAMPSLGKSKGTGALKASRSAEEVARLKSAAQAKREQRWARNLANARPDMILHTVGSSL